jgi:hypothetical protein
MPLSGLQPRGEKGQARGLPCDFDNHRPRAKPVKYIAGPVYKCSAEGAECEFNQVVLGNLGEWTFKNQVPERVH